MSIECQVCGEKTGTVFLYGGICNSSYSDCHSKFRKDSKVRAEATTRRLRKSLILENLIKDKIIEIEKTYILGVNTN